MKKCPFCAEEIQDEAIKCKHCHEFLHIKPIAVVSNLRQRYFSIKDIAIYLGLSEGAIRKWIRSGEIPFVKLNGAIKFDIKQVERWAGKGIRNTLKPVSVIN